MGVFQFHTKFACDTGTKSLQLLKKILPFFNPIFDPAQINDTFNSGGKRNNNNTGGASSSGDGKKPKMDFTRLDNSITEVALANSSEFYIYYSLPSSAGEPLQVTRFFRGYPTSIFRKMLATRSNKVQDLENLATEAVSRSSEGEINSGFSSTKDRIQHLTYLSRVNKDYVNIARRVGSFNPLNNKIIRRFSSGVNEDVDL